MAGSWLWPGGLLALGLLSLFAVVFLRFGVSHRQVAHVHQPLLPRLESDSPERTAAIWQAGIEDQFEANVYPSKLAAVRSLGLRIDEPIGQLFGDESWPKKGILFQGTHGDDVLGEFTKTLSTRFPQTQWTTALETVAVEPGEVGIRLDLTTQIGRAPWKDAWNSGNPRDVIIAGKARANVMTGNRQIGINAEFEEKPWIENFYGVWNDRPNTRLIIAKSTESCLTEAEANGQAMADACNQLTVLLRQSPRAQATPSLPRNVTTNDILERDFIVDRFAQNFGGRAGKIWRQALLIDASPGRLEELASHKAAVARAIRWSWARMAGSIAGLLVLVTVVYAFLNAATKGYYVWSLRIAGIVLAAAVIILFVV
ncbi:MAG: hypothetical protein ACYTDV_06950 [Planctomycetota bacterium]